MNSNSSNGNSNLATNEQREHCQTNGRTGIGNEEMELKSDAAELIQNQLSTLGERAEEDQHPNGQEQMYLLRWHRHAPTITEHLPTMYEMGLFADVTLNVDGQALKAHRLILASCSSYFLQIFQEADRINIEHPYVVLLNANLEDIRAILNFIYKGECCVFRNRIPELIATAKNLRISGLSDMQVEDYILPQFKEPVQPEPINLMQKAATYLQLQSHPPKMNHTNNRDVPETCKCFVCGKYLSNQYNLRVHMETHDETYHACSSCPHVSRSRDALRKHMSYRHPDKYNARKHRRSTPTTNLDISPDTTNLRVELKSE